MWNFAGSGSSMVDKRQYGKHGLVRDADWSYPDRIRECVCYIFVSILT